MYFPEDRLRGHGSATSIPYDTFKYFDTGKVPHCVTDHRPIHGSVEGFEKLIIATGFGSYAYVMGSITSGIIAA